MSAFLFILRQKISVKKVQPLPKYLFLVQRLTIKSEVCYTMICLLACLFYKNTNSDIKALAWLLFYEFIYKNYRRI